MTNYIANARWSWVSCDDVALVGAETLRRSQEHQGRIYPLGYNAATTPEIANLLIQIVGKPFQLDNLSPEEFLETVLKAGGDPAYMQCIYHQLKLSIANAIPQADATFNNFEQITGHKPMTWQSLIQQECSSFTY